jgi:protein ImuA
MSSLRARQLVVLRDRMRRLEKPRAAELPVLSLGLPVLDNVLPWGGLPTGALHEILGRPGDAAACGFAVRLLRDLVRLRRRPVLWCRGDEDTGAPYAPGLMQNGLACDSVIFARTRKPAELLWAMEEGLRSGAFAAVYGEDAAPDLTATRRLQLAAEAGATTALLSLPYRVAGGVSAALTRWRVTSVPVEAEETARWQIELTRCRGGEGGAWQVTCSQGEGDEALRLRLAAVLADRSLASDAAE